MADFDDEMDDGPERYLYPDAVMAVIRGYNPVFRNRADRLAFGIHAAFIASGYALRAAGHAAMANGHGPNDLVADVGIDEHWNSIPSRYSFFYFYPGLNAHSTTLNMYVEDNNMLRITSTMYVVDQNAQEGFGEALEIGYYVDEETNEFQHLDELLQLLYQGVIIYNQDVHQPIENGLVQPQAIEGVVRAYRPYFRNATDKVVFAVHAAFSASDFLLHYTGRLPNLEFDPNTNVVVGIQNWNQDAHIFNFVYSYPALDAIKITVSMVHNNGRLHLRAEKEDIIRELEIGVGNYIPENGETSYRYQDLHGLAVQLDTNVIRFYIGDLSD